MGRTRLQFLKINMIHHLSKPSYGDMMNSFEYQQGSQLSLTKNEHPPNTHAKTEQRDINKYKYEYKICIN